MDCLPYTAGKHIVAFLPVGWRKRANQAVSEPAAMKSLVNEIEWPARNTHVSAKVLATVLLQRFRTQHDATITRPGFWDVSSALRSAARRITQGWVVYDDVLGKPLAIPLQAGQRFGGASIAFNASRPCKTTHNTLVNWIVKPAANSD